MIRIKFREPPGEGWAKWKADAAEKTKALIDAAKRGEKPKIDEKFYKLRRVDIKALFHYKCAYCEEQIISSQRGDVEHFRPKSAVTDREGKPVQVRTPDGSMQDHPGYYWLAYDPSNLLLACIRCNQGNKDADGSSYGKLDYFPVEGEYVCQPGDVSREKPLFVNPLEEDPEPWFIFDEETGFVAALDNNPRALWCIDRLGLNRERLPEKRRSTFISFTGQFEQVANATIQGIDDIPRFAATVQELLEAKRGRGEFTFVFRGLLRIYRERAKKLFELFG